MMDTKIEVGRENIYFETESKQFSERTLSFQKGHSTGKTKRRNTAV